MTRRRLTGAMGALLPLLLAAMPAFAEDAGPPKIDTGDTAWMLASTALVLLMTVPGLALFYGGMVRKKNILATLMQSFAITCIVTIVWCVAGYSLAFTTPAMPPMSATCRASCCTASPTTSPRATTPGLRSRSRHRTSRRRPRRSPRPST